jgi:hypothetical protein
VAAPPNPIVLNRKFVVLNLSAHREDTANVLQQSLFIGVNIYGDRPWKYKRSIDIALTNTNIGDIRKKYAHVKTPNCKIRSAYFIKPYLALPAN